MFDFVRLARDHGIPISFEGPKNTRGWVQTHCPWCDRGSGFHLGFNLSSNAFNCWRCGKLTRRDVLTGLLNITQDEAKKLSFTYGDERKYTRPVVPQKKSIKRTKKVEPPPGMGKLRKAHREYLRGRGFGSEHRKLWELSGTAHLSGAWNWRVVFPIKNADGVVQAYLGRSIQEDHPRKYRMTENEKCLSDPGGFLYGINHVPGDSVIIVEGPTDVWNMGPGTVATLGVDWKMEQMMKLKEFARRFILFDPGRLAQRQAQKLADALSFFPGETEIITGLPSDPGSLPKREIRTIRRDLLGKEFA